MNHKYDFYAAFYIKEKEDVDNLTNGSGRYDELRDILSRIMILSTARGVKEKFDDRKGRPNEINPKDYARVGEGNHVSGLKALTHTNGNFNEYIACKLSELALLGINAPINVSILPIGSWVLEFPITLTKPFISKDDVPLYIIDNPIKKDKVFGVPFTSAMAWKGNLRWTMMKFHLESHINEPNKFAEIRLKHTLLFGTEKGTEDVPKGWAKYLDKLCPNARENYQDKLKKKFGRDDIPNLAGMLHFYPTFWDRIDMEVINPHDRKTKTGKNPIYFEAVPEGSKGLFRLLYIPLHWTNLRDDEFKKMILQDLRDVVAGLKEMLLFYGFSAKKSIGYGVIEDSFDKEVSTLALKDFIRGTEKFGNLEELENKIESFVRGRDYE